MFCGLCKDLLDAKKFIGRLHSGLNAPCPNQNCNRQVYWPSQRLYDEAVNRVDRVHQPQKIEARRSGRVDTNFPNVDIPIRASTSYSIDIATL